MHCVYLHGYLSKGDRSFKSLLLKDYLLENFPKVNFHAPNYPDWPSKAVVSLQEFFLALKGEDTIVVGSSMGGFYATLLQQRFGFDAILLNPCVHPQDFFASLVQRPSDELKVLIDNTPLKDDLIDTLTNLDKTISLRHDKFMVYLQDGDEVLDYLKAVSFYKGCHIDIQGGGDHGLSNFAAYLPGLFTPFASKMRS